MTGTTRYVIGVDIGTTNTKAVAFTPAGELLGSAHASYPALSAAPDHHELDPVVLLDAVVETLKKVLSDKTITNAASLAGISFSCAMHSLIVIGPGDELLTNAITWADLRSKEYATALKGSETGKRIYQHTGTPIHPMSPLCKLLWLKDKEPGIYSQAAKFVSIKEYIWYRFFGKWVVDYSIASATGLFDIYSFDWYDESLKLAGIDASLLSSPVPCTHAETSLLPEYRKTLGFDDGTKGRMNDTTQLSFIIGGSDGCMANLGSNAVLPGEAALTIGTSGAIRMIAEKPEYDLKERIFNYILTRDRYVSGGAINNGGAVVQWYVDNFCKGIGDGGNDLGDASGDDLSRYIDMAGTVAPGSDGLIFLPYLFGERAPIWNADARGMFFGIHASHTRAHFMRAVIEGICFSLYHVGASLEETIGPIRNISASGGFIRSKLWLRIIADIFGKTVSVNNIADASAIGAAITGFYALGLIEGLEEVKKMIHTQETFEPDEERHLIYGRSFAKYKELYIRVRDLY